MLVDDMIVAASSDRCDGLRNAFSESFPVNNLGPLIWYTGCAFKRDTVCSAIKIHQTTCIDGMLNCFNVSP